MQEADEQGTALALRHLDGLLSTAVLQIHVASAAHPQNPISRCFIPANALELFGTFIKTGQSTADHEMTLNVPDGLCM
jgi:hypothetical protein